MTRESISFHGEPDPADEGCPEPKHLVLIGYRGSGKSTLGPILARALRRPFVDLDERVQRRTGKSIAAIFAESGEPAFRDLEEAALRTELDGPVGVIATGGGAILRASNRRAMKQRGIVVYLRAEADVLRGRLENESGSRPALTAAGTLGEIEAVLERRSPLYLECADLVVDASAPPEIVADSVLARLPGSRR